MTQTGERRIRPGADKGEVVEVEEMRSCPCQHCSMDEHWMWVFTVPLRTAEKHVAAHNLARAHAGVDA